MAAISFAHCSLRMCPPAIGWLVWTLCVMPGYWVACMDALRHAAHITVTHAGIVSCSCTHHATIPYQGYAASCRAYHHRCSKLFKKTHHKSTVSRVPRRATLWCVAPK